MTITGRRLAIADNNLLVNFVDADRGDLLYRYCGGPVLISPSVIEPTEHAPFTRPPTSEFNVIIYKAQLAALRQDRQRERREEIEPIDPLLERRAHRRLAFLRHQGILWEAVEISEEHARRRFALQQDPQFKRLKRRQADAECLALAEVHGWTLLTDDQPVVDAAAVLGVPTLRTCALLVQMVQAGLLTVHDAEELFNTVMVDEYGFNARRVREGRRERLVLSGDPPGCHWVER